MNMLRRGGGVNAPTKPSRGGGGSNQPTREARLPEKLRLNCCQPTLTLFVFETWTAADCRQHIQMSRPSQAKLNTADHNGVSVIQSQAHATASSSSLPAAVAGLQQVPQLVPANPTPGGGKAVPPSKMKKPLADKDSEEYRQRRERNNLAVKKSRMRSKQKAMDTQQRVNELKEENERLEAKIKLLSKELSVLKDLFLEHAHNLADNVQPPVGAGSSSPAPSSNTNSSNGQ